MKKSLLITCILILIAIAGSGAQASALTPAGGGMSEGISSPQASPPFIIDHNSVDITAIPQSWIEQAKNTLHIYYGHTSHGNQLTTGMAGLVDFANGGGLGLSLPTDIFAGLPIVETYPDAGFSPAWVNNTTT